MTDSLTDGRPVRTLHSLPPDYRCRQTPTDLQQLSATANAGISKNNSAFEKFAQHPVSVILVTRPAKQTACVCACFSIAFALDKNGCSKKFLNLIKLLLESLLPRCLTGEILLEQSYCWSYSSGEKSYQRSRLRISELQKGDRLLLKNLFERDLLAERPKKFESQTLRACPNSRPLKVAASNSSSIQRINFI